MQTQCLRSEGMEGCGEGRMRRKEQVPRAGVDLSQ